jgi:hypothetical protein
MRREYAKQNKAKRSRRNEKQHLPESTSPFERLACGAAISPNTEMASCGHPRKHSAVGGQVKKRKASSEMSGYGLVSARIPRSLLEALKASAQRQGISIHEAARRLTDKLPSLTRDDLRTLKEPPREQDSPRVSLYIGWDLLDVLADAAHESDLTNSSIFRRLLYGFLVTKQVEFVQQNNDWKLKIVSTKHSEYSRS